MATEHPSTQPLPAHELPLAQRFEHIKGWGADLDPEDRPAVPKERTPPRLTDEAQRPPQQQPVTVEVFHSNERPGLTPVFGSTLPPSGLSGRMRSVAFKYSENDLRHWLLLLAADRVNVAEGVLTDLKSGHVPNLFAESGGRAAMRYNRSKTLRQIAVKTAVISAIAGAGIYLARRRRR